MQDNDEILLINAEDLVNIFRENIILSKIIMMLIMKMY